MRFGGCCGPLPGDDIVGFVTRGRGVTVHSAECQRVFDVEPERRIEVSWDADPGIVERVNRNHGLTLQTSEDPWGASDHTSFYARGMPVLHLFTNTHAEYHRQSDDWDLINMDGVVQVAAYAADVAWELATQETLTFATVAAPAPASGGGYGASLGTIPDMSGTPGGVLLTGVREGTPADSVGIRGGDILVQLGEFEIGDLYDMTDALRAYKPGETVDYAVIRDGQRVEGRVTLGRRGG